MSVSNTSQPNIRLPYPADYDFSKDAGSVAVKIRWIYAAFIYFAASFNYMNRHKPVEKPALNVKFEEFLRKIMQPNISDTDTILFLPDVAGHAKEGAQEELQKVFSEEIRLYLENTKRRRYICFPASVPGHAMAGIIRFYNNKCMMYIINPNGGENAIQQFFNYIKKYFEALPITLTKHIVTNARYDFSFQGKRGTCLLWSLFLIAYIMCNITVPFRKLEADIAQLTCRSRDRLLKRYLIYLFDEISGASSFVGKPNPFHEITNATTPIALKFKKKIYRDTIHNIEISHSDDKMGGSSGSTGTINDTDVSLSIYSVCALFQQPFPITQKVQSLLFPQISSNLQHAPLHKNEEFQKYINTTAYRYHDHYDIVTENMDRNVAVINILRNAFGIPDSISYSVLRFNVSETGKITNSQSRYFEGPLVSGVIYCVCSKPRTRSPSTTAYFFVIYLDEKTHQLLFHFPSNLVIPADVSDDGLGFHMTQDKANKSANTVEQQICNIFTTALKKTYHVSNPHTGSVNGGRDVFNFQRSYDSSKAWCMYISLVLFLNAKNQKSFLEIEDTYKKQLSHKARYYLTKIALYSYMGLPKDITTEQTQHDIKELVMKNISHSSNFHYYESLVAILTEPEYNALRNLPIYKHNRKLQVPKPNYLKQRVGSASSSTGARKDQSLFPIVEQRTVTLSSSSSSGARKGKSPKSHQVIVISSDSSSGHKKRPLHTKIIELSS